MMRQGVGGCTQRVSNLTVKSCPANRVGNMQQQLAETQQLVEFNRGLHIASPGRRLNSQAEEQELTEMRVTSDEE